MHATQPLRDNFLMFFFIRLQKEMTYIPLARVSLDERMWIIWVKRYYFFDMIK